MTPPAPIFEASLPISNWVIFICSWMLAEELSCCCCPIIAALLLLGPAVLGANDDLARSDMMKRRQLLRR